MRLLAATLLFAASLAQAQSADTAARLADARDTIRMERIALMPEAIRYLGRNSRALDDQLLILGQAACYDTSVRQEVSRMAVYMDPKAEHLRAVKTACDNIFPEARTVCLYVASRVPGDESDELLLRAAFSGDRMTAPMAAQALGNRMLRREDADRLEHIFDLEAGPRWTIALTALQSTADPDRVARIGSRVMASTDVDAKLLFKRLYKVSEGGVHPPPER